MNKKEKKMTTTKTVKEKNQTFLQKKQKQWHLNSVKLDDAQQ